MPTTGKSTAHESAGRSVTVTLSHSIEANQVVYAEGFLGVSARSGDSGAMVALTIERAEYQFVVPASLDVAKGDTVYIDLSGVAAWDSHTPPEAAYGTTPGQDKVALFKATAAKTTANVVTGILLAGF